MARLLCKFVLPQISLKKKNAERNKGLEKVKKIKPTLAFFAKHKGAFFLNLAKTK